MATHHPHDIVTRLEAFCAQRHTTDGLGQGPDLAEEAALVIQILRRRVEAYRRVVSEVVHISEHAKTPGGDPVGSDTLTWADDCVHRLRVQGLL